MMNRANRFVLTFYYFSSFFHTQLDVCSYYTHLKLVYIAMIVNFRKSFLLLTLGNRCQVKVTHFIMLLGGKTKSPGRIVQSPNGIGSLAFSLFEK
jgi:hypothetical protein